MINIPNILEFFDEVKVQNYIRALRWKDKQLQCPHCHSSNVGGWGTYHRKPGLRRYRCKDCETTFNDLTGTIFNGSRLPLCVWLLMAFLMVLGCSSSRIANELSVTFKTALSRIWELRNLALFYEVGRKLFGVVEVDEIYQTAGKKGKKNPRCKYFNPNARKRGKKKGPGRGDYKKDTPCIVAWVCRGGKILLQVVKSFNFDTVKKMAENILYSGCGVVYSDSAKPYRILARMGFIHKSVNHSKKEYVKEHNVHENRAENVFSLLKPFLLTFRGVSKDLLPVYVVFFQFLTNFREKNCFKKVELILVAALDPEIAVQAKEGKYADHFLETLRF